MKVISRDLSAKIEKTVTPKVTMMVCCHKKDYFRSGDGFIPIQVGKAISKIDLGIESDNVGENISIKNPNYCELTAHYWLWANRKYGKYVGLSHYRRYFAFNRKIPLFLNYQTLSLRQVEQDPPTLPDDLDEIMKDYDIVLAKPNYYPHSLEYDYCYCHIIEDYNILMDVVKELYPEYFESFEAVMKYSNKLSPYNMFLTKDYIFEDYSEWLFKILFEVEKRCKISQYPNQARIFGYMSERLLNVYTHKHRLKIKFVPIIKIEDSNQKQYPLLHRVKCLLFFSIEKISRFLKKSNNHINETT